jgi:hypothetical protein
VIDVGVWEGRGAGVSALFSHQKIDSSCFTGAPLLVVCYSWIPLSVFLRSH